MTKSLRKPALIKDTLGLKHCRSGIEVVYNTSAWDINSIRQQHVLACDSCVVYMVMQGKDTIKQSRNGNHQSSSYSPVVNTVVFKAARDLVSKLDTYHLLYHQFRMLFNDLNFNREKRQEYFLFLKC